MEERTRRMTLSQEMMSGRTKIRFDLEPGNEQGYEAEHLWAESVGPEEFRILNSPFFAFGISLDDIVRAEKMGDSYVFRNVVRRSGHSTYRLFLQGNRTIADKDFTDRWHEIAKEGCTFENANGSLVTVDCPTKTDVSAVYELLKRGEDEGIWAFEEGHYASQASN
jgi:hypothetical protein